MSEVMSYVPSVLVILWAMWTSAAIRKNGDRILDILAEKFMIQPQSVRLVLPRSSDSAASDMSLD